MTPQEYDWIKSYLTRSVSSGSLVRTLSAKSLTDKPHSRRPNLSGSLLPRKMYMSDLMNISERSGLSELDVSERGLNTYHHRVRKVLRQASTNNLVSIDQGENAIKRIWKPDSAEKIPGCAFTRSLGDTVGKELGVIATPEFKQMDVCSDDIIVIASDGVTECEYS